MATALSIDLRELDRELAQTQSAVEAWAKGRDTASVTRRDTHLRTMEDQSGEEEPCRPNV